MKKLQVEEKKANQLDMRTQRKAWNDQMRKLINLVLFTSHRCKDIGNLETSVRNLDLKKCPLKGLHQILPSSIIKI